MATHGKWIGALAVVGVLGIVIVVGVIAWGIHSFLAVEDMMAATKEDETRFATGAPAAAVAAAPDPTRARLVSINVKYMSACAWVDTGGDDGVMPIQVNGFEDNPGKISYEGSILPIAHRPLRERVDAAFQRQLSLVVCEDKMPPKPKGVVENPAVDGPLSRLWAEPPNRWAVIPSGDGGYLGVSRRTKGGDIQTPEFDSAAAVEAWIAKTGSHEADVVNTSGRALWSASGACIAKAKGAEWKECPDWDTDYTVLAMGDGL